jgi:hypothetical protein
MKSAEGGPSWRYTSRWFCMLQKRTERMYDERLDPRVTIVWTLEPKAAGRPNNDHERAVMVNL